MSSRPKKLLVTGVSGFVGSVFAQIASKTYQVYGIYHQHPLAIPHCHLQSTDLRNHRTLLEELKSIQPDVLVHLSAIAQPSQCEQTPQNAYQINVEVTRWLTEYCALAQIPFVFASTDLVFNGREAPYVETDATTPLNLYGHHKAEAEKSVLEILPHALICRFPLLFGRSLCTKNFMQEWLHHLATGKTIKLFVDEFRTATTPQAVTQGILLLLEQGASGIYHLGGKERISRYEFGQMLARVFHYSESQLIACYQKDLNLTALRPADTSLNSQKAFDLGYTPPSTLTALHQYEQYTR